MASGGSKLPTCASELERSATPHSTAEDCLLGTGDAVNIEDGEDYTASVKLLLSKYINHPVVTVTLVDNVTQMRYFVDGDVLQPGRYSLVAPITVLEAVEKAEGFKPGANLKIVVQRQRGAELRLDYNGLLKHPERNVSLRNGDLVMFLN